jgi:hypothetical protein
MLNDLSVFQPENVDIGSPQVVGARRSVAVKEDNIALSGAANKSKL